MAIRPVVFVYQDLATPTVTPTSPDLNCLVVGPAFFLQDYYTPGTTDYADKADILTTSAYGALEGDPTDPLPTGTAYLTIAEPPNNATGAVLDGDSVVIFFDNARVVIASGSDGVTSDTTPNTITSAGAAWTTGDTAVLPGDRITIMDEMSVVISRTVLAVTSDTGLTVTSDVTGGTFTPGTAQNFRIERRINDTQIAASFVTTNGNSIILSGDVTLAVTGQGDHDVSYAKVYIQYRSLRQDLPDLDTVESQTEILSKIGRIDYRNPLASGAFVALQNTTSMVQFCAVLTDNLNGHTAVRDQITPRPDVYAIIPLSTDTSVFAMWNADCVGLALPDATSGRPQRFRVVIGNGTLPTTKTIIEPSVTGVSTALTGSAPTAITKGTLTGIASLLTAGVVPGDILRVTVTADATKIALGDYLVASVESAAIITVDTATPFAGAGTVNITCLIRKGDDTGDRVSSAALIGAVTAAHPDLYLTLQDPSGTFIANGVAAGDLINIPVDPNTIITDASVFTTFVVASIQSDQRLLIINNGQDLSTTENELPHGAKRTGTTLVNISTISYEIVRTLSKSQQVTSLIADAQSFNSKRTVLTWPDQCDVAGVTGGTKQPGFYLAAAVGGMTAGLPSQQGFTNLGIAGISQIYHANTYFSDPQLTDISNGGWFVFAQQTPTSLPYTIHQLTTDPSTLEYGEFSVVKNFDFVSLFFVDILEAFLGQYNVTDETLGLIRSALITGGDLLRLRTVAKIGAPLTSFSITQIGVSPSSADRVLVYLAIGLPRPLNVIELHLVA